MNLHDLTQLNIPPFRDGTAKLLFDQR